MSKEKVQFPARITKSGNRYYINVPKIYIEHGWLAQDIDYIVNVEVDEKEKGKEKKKD